MRFWTTFILFILFQIAYQPIFGQTRNLTGVVKDSLGNPVENANVIAKPSEESTSTLKFFITDFKGRYKLTLDKKPNYRINVSYIGYQDQSFIYKSSDSTRIHNFILKPKNENLKEIVIKYDYQPLIIKKDTLIYDVDAFTNGTEEKLKDQLNKLPGVEVGEDGSVKVQGKTVTNFMVEGKSFFGGGTKLGVENIPANAVDKVEVIDHFTKVGFLKKVSDSDQLAMDISLKKDHKKFIFGNAEGGLGNRDFYLAKTALFYYTPETNMSFIGNLNNIGESTFSYKDLNRFQGGVSTFLNHRKNLSNLYSFTLDNKNVLKNKTQFAGLNFSKTLFHGLDANGFFIFSKSIMDSKNQTETEYLQTETFEDRQEKSNQRSLLGLGNIKLDYKPNENEQWYYNIHYQASNNDLKDFLRSKVSGNLQNKFNTFQNADNSALKQYLEWHKSYSENQKSSLVINHVFEKEKPKLSLFSNQAFFEGLLPLQNDENYNVNSIKSIKRNSLDGLFKYYWLLNDFNAIYVDLGDSYIHTKLTTKEEQVLTDGPINGFANNGFGNNLDYQLNDLYLNIKYKFKIGDWVNTPGLYLNYYSLKNQQQEDIDRTYSKVLLEPHLKSEFDFNDSEKLILTYDFSNTFPDSGQLANNFTLENYNSIYKGNALLKNERYHSASLRYSKLRVYNDFTVNANLNFSKRTKNIRNRITLNGIDQLSTPILTNDPETSLAFIGFMTKKIYRFKLGFTTNLSWYNYIQEINEKKVSSQRNYQVFGFELRTDYKKWPYAKISYNKNFNALSGFTNSHYQSDEFSAEIHYEIVKNFILKTDYDFFSNKNPNGQWDSYNIANASLRYRKTNSHFGFRLIVNNLFDVRRKTSNSFSDFFIRGYTQYILPRVILVSVDYKI